MATYKTPGVYVEEISTFPPSVAQVSTAVPAFIGYTERGGRQVARINTLLEYETLFGRAQPSTFTAKVQVDPQTKVATFASLERDVVANASVFLMYYCLSMYFRNGGGTCYIISIGDYGDYKKDNRKTPVDDFLEGLAELEKEDEPTLILLTDAINLGADYYTICQAALAQCAKLGDRFAILDVPDADTLNNFKNFREGVGSESLLYGAAYYPYLQTSLTYQFTEVEVKLAGLNGDGGTDSTWRKAFGTVDQSNGIIVSFTGSTGATPQVKIVASGDEATPFQIENEKRQLTVRNATTKTGAGIAAAWTDWKKDNNPQGFDIFSNDDGGGQVDHTNNNFVDLDPMTLIVVSNNLAAIRSTNTALYNQVKATMAQQRVVLPPSSAIAGIYATVDRERGVWKAPANVSLAGVIGPITKITHEDQENLNVDPTAGKSINAIRAFTGKGTLVWGARTLAGNDNEWRYISVRRLFNMIEESTKKATGFAVFEPNDAATWLKVKAMIESYLYGLWEQGALAGPTPAAAYFVNVGLGKTMTPQDILEGRMIVEIGVAAVRPAEFIILRFTHKLQEA
jgi:uncharacterized protein